MLNNGHNSIAWYKASEKIAAQLYGSDWSVGGVKRVCIKQRIITVRIEECRRSVGQA
jgi:hypothetical protein